LFFSYDTEALNKLCDIDILSNKEFENKFQQYSHKKINTGIQQLYIIGLYDALPIKKLLNIFIKYLPKILFNKLSRYVNSEPTKIYSTIHWNTFKSKIDQIDMTECTKEIISLLNNLTISEKNVNIFHIFQNHKTTNSTEPNHKNTAKMILNFLTYIYQRNILASLIKYILLQPLLNTFNTSLFLTQKRGIFFNMHQRLQEIIFECTLTSFNGSNYDNYLLCNSLILIQSRLHQKIKIFKKGASISSILCINKNNFYKKKINCNKKSTSLTNKKIISGL